MFKVNNKDTRTTPLASWEVFHSVATCLVDFTTFFNTMKWLEVPYNFESHGPLKLSFINIRGLRCYFVSCDPLRKSNFADIFTLCETNLENSIHFSNISVRHYFLLM